MILKAEDNHNVFLEEAKEVFENTVLAVERTTIELWNR